MVYLIIQRKKIKKIEEKELYLVASALLHGAQPPNWLLWLRLYCMALSHRIGIVASALFHGAQPPNWQAFIVTSALLHGAQLPELVPL